MKCDSDVTRCTTEIRRKKKHRSKHQLNSKNSANLGACVLGTTAAQSSRLYKGDEVNNGGNRR